MSVARITAEELRSRIAKVPRVRLAFLPTPLQHCPHLSTDLGIDLWVKRDDLTGLALGGNKTRNLEFRMAEALSAGADVLVYGVELTSNAARQTAAAANLLGLPLVLVLRGQEDAEVQGNLLCDLLLGAQVRVVSVPSPHDLGKEIEKTAEELCGQGRKPFVLNRASMFARSAALAYIECFLEVLEQLAAQRRFPEHVFICSGGKGQAGLVLAAKALALDTKITGIAASRSDDPWRSAAWIANETAALLNIDVHVTPEEVENTFEYVGEDYGIPTAAGMEAVVRFARRDAILLDPVYTGKAAAGFIDYVRRGKVRAGTTTVFIHTGGQPALFSQSRDLVRYLQRASSENSVRIQKR